MYQDPGFSSLNSKLSSKIVVKRNSRDSEAKLRTSIPVPLQKAQLVKFPAQRIFLDLSLDDITNLPNQYSNLEIGFKHSNGISKVKRTCVEEPNNLELNKFEYYKPQFRLNIEPHNIDNLNKISDEPVMITLYEHIKPKPKFRKYWPILDEYEEYLMFDAGEGAEEEEEDDVEDHLVALAQGHLDLLQLLSEQKVTISMETFMYSTNFQINQLTSLKTKWKIKSATALLGENVADILFIAMESIYNAPLELIELSANLGVKLSFQAKKPTSQTAANTDRRSTSRKSKTSKSDNQLSSKVEICTYEHFQSTFLANQAICLKWETLKDVDIDNLFCIGIHTPIRVKSLHPFEGLLRTEYVDFQLNKINPEEDTVIVANSLHRYLLPQAYCQVLEEIVACNEQHILVEVYHVDAPHIILYEGIIDLSVLAFPQANARRFAVELLPKRSKSFQSRTSNRLSSNRAPATQRRTTERISKKSINSKKSVNALSEEEIIIPEPEKPVFIIISICLQTPISEANLNTSQQLISVPITENRCTYIAANSTKTNTINICARLYQQFDQLIKEMTEFIMNRRIKSMSEAQDYFCCQLSEMRNILSGIIACDYNTKFHTNSNVEFTVIHFNL